MKRQFFLVLASMLFSLAVNAKGAETASIFDETRWSDSTNISVNISNIPSVFAKGTTLGYRLFVVGIAKIDDKLGNISFCSFGHNIRSGRGRWSSLNEDKQHYDTLEQALSGLQVILLRRWITNRRDVLIGGECKPYTYLESVKEFTPFERAKIDNFLKGKLFDPDAASPKSSPDPFAKSTEEASESDQKDVNKVKITTKFVEVGGGTEERSFDWVSPPVKVSTAEATSDSEEELTFDWVVTPFFEKEIPDFAVSEEDILKPFYDIGFSKAPRERLAKIIGAYDVLKDGKTITEEVEEQNEARFFIVYDGKRYLLSMRKVIPNKVSYVFVMDSLDSASINEKGEIVRSNETKEHVRIFENEPLYHKLEQFLETHQSRAKKN